MDKQPIKIKLVFMDESELLYTTNTTDRKAAISDFYIKAWIEVDGVFYNKAFVFTWQIVGD